MINFLRTTKFFKISILVIFFCTFVFPSVSMAADTRTLTDKTRDVILAPAVAVVNGVQAVQTAGGAALANDQTIISIQDSLAA
jgi:hypothetical protein